MSKLNTLVKTVDDGLENYKIFETARTIQDFTDELSNWYVRRGRERYWGSEMTEDKAAAYTTLYTVLVTLAKICAPFVPFMTESMYRNLVVPFYKDAPESVHLCDFPVADESLIDPELERGMEAILEIVALGRAARNGSNIKNRQPLDKLYIASDRKIDLTPELYGIARDELNIKRFEVLRDVAKFVRYKLKPQLKTLGPKYGALLGGIRQYLENGDTREIVERVRSGKPFEFEVNGKPVSLTLDDLLISSEPAEGYVSESTDGLTVVLDAHVTDELLMEGTVREIVSRVQNMRKEAGFEVTDRIELGYSAEGVCAKAFITLGDDIARDVLAEKLVDGLFDGYTKYFDINGDKVTLVVKKA